MSSPIKEIQHRRTSRKGQAAFSLVEMLLVTSIIAVVMTVATNVMRVDSQRAAVNAAIDNLKGLMNTARWEARSKSSFVWVCLKPATSNGENGVKVAVFSSRDGTSNTAPGNLMSVGPTLTLKHVTLGQSTQETPTRLRDDYTAASVANDSVGRLGGASTTISDGAQNNYSDYIVCFNPRGEASIPGVASAPIIEVLIRPQVSSAGSDAKASALLLSQATGSAQVYR